MNVVHGDRWRVLPDEVLQYALGWYGQPIAPIEPELREKIDAAPRFAELRASGPPQPTLDELRERFDERDDDALILRYLIAAPFIEKMQAAGPVPRDFARFGDPALERVRGYLDERGLARLDVSTPDLTLALAR
jgi:oxaloacetate decarboxylase alpha subunit